MSRDAPTLDDLNGPGAEEASDFAEHLDDLRERCLAYAKVHAGDFTTATEEIYDPVITKLHDENRRLEGQLVSAGEEIERLKNIALDAHAGLTR
jgi:hypothetical protein